MRGTLSWRMARGNVRRSLSDYSVYFATLAFCSCLLCTYASCGDTIRAIGSDDLAGMGLLVLERAQNIVVPLGFFSVVVFGFLASYANRFIVRRRRHELGTLQLLGMRRGQVRHILWLECAMVGAAAAAAGIALAIVLSPLAGALAAWAYGISWKPVFVVSPSGIALALAGFAAIAFCSAGGAAKELRKTPLIGLIQGDRVSEASTVPPRAKLVRQLAAGAALLALGYGICLSLVGFIPLMIPMIVCVCQGSLLAVRSATLLAAERLHGNPRVEYRGLACFVMRQLERHVSTSAAALTISAALLSVGACAVAMAAGLRSALYPLAAEDAEAMYAAGSFVYIVLFFGLTFLVSALAVLALHQLAESYDAHPSYRKLAQIGAGPAALRHALRAQVGAGFAVPGAVAFVHVLVGFFVAEGLLVYLFGLPPHSVSYPVVGLCVAVLFVAYGAATEHACARAMERASVLSA